MRTLAPTGWPPDLDLLLGGAAAGILGAAVAAAGGRLEGWRARQVTHQPGHSTMVQYRAEVTWSDGSTSAETIVAATGARIPDGAAVLDDGTTSVAVWRWPSDPLLPGLVAALDRHRVGRLLDDIGVDGGVVQLRVRAYRPGRRAVVEASGRRGRLFLKVVRPSTVEALHRTHRELAAHLPVPDSLGWTDDGIVVLPGLPGCTLRDGLRSARTLPSPSAITGLLDRLPAALVDGPARRSTVAGAGHQADVLRSALPSARGRIDDLAAAIAARALVGHDLVPVHGDLHEAQLLIDERGTVAGLLDVDTTSGGARADDLANLCAHLSVLALTSDRPKPVRRYLAAVLAHAETTLDRADLRTRIAAGVLGLATGPFRVLEPNWEQATIRRLELASSLLAEPRAR